MHLLSISARRIWSDSICGGLLLARCTVYFSRAVQNAALVKVDTEG